MMKINIIKTTFVFLILIGMVSCGKQPSNNNESGEVAQERRAPESGFILHFEEDSFDFGTIDATRAENEFLSTEFVFINHNDRPLIIHRASVSCVCLSVEIPHQPILSGEKGVVTVTLNTQRVAGRFARSVFVSSNAENDVELLRVSGIVNN